MCSLLPGYLADARCGPFGPAAGPSGPLRPLRARCGPFAPAGLAPRAPLATGAQLGAFPRLVLAARFPGYHLPGYFPGYIDWPGSYLLCHSNRLCEI